MGRAIDHYNNLSNQPRSTKPKLIDQAIILTGYEDAPQCRLPPVGFANANPRVLFSVKLFTRPEFRR
jgi:hypothetical protein